MRGKKSEKHVKPKEKKPFKYGDSILQGFLVLLLSLAAVATGLSIPGLAAGVQNKRVDNYTSRKQLEPGALSLTADDTKLTKLSLAVELMLNGDSEFRLVELENGRFLTHGEAKDRLRDVLELAEGTGLYSGLTGDWQELHGEPNLLIPVSGDTSTGLVWIMYASCQMGDEVYSLRFLVDDTSGLVIAVEIKGPNGMMPENREETLKRLAENMSRYYAFSDVELIPQSGDELRQNDGDDCCIHFVRNGETVLDVPVALRDSSWEIK